MGETRSEREDKQRLQIALARAVDVEEEIGLNERSTDHARWSYWTTIMGVNRGTFPRYLLGLIDSQGKGEFWQSVDSLNRLISAESSLSDLKTQARKGDQRGGDRVDREISEEDREYIERLERALERFERCRDAADAPDHEE